MEEGLKRASRDSLRHLATQLGHSATGNKGQFAKHIIETLPVVLAENRQLRSQLGELRADIERAQQSLRGQVDGRKNGVKA